MSPFNCQRTLVLLFLPLLILAGDSFLKFTPPLSWKIYDAFSRFSQQLFLPPPSIRKIVLVAIDSDTIAQMKERWPYSRATFAKVIQNLKDAEAQAIGLDFSFFGETSLEDDAKLVHAVRAGGHVILGATLGGERGIQFSTLKGLSEPSLSGIVNKLQDSDGVTRSAVTYLVSASSSTPRTQHFSWEMKLLERSGGIRLDSLKDGGALLAAGDPPWKIPVDPVTKTFLIRFRARTADFSRFSFYQIFSGEFDSRQVEGKIVLVGFLAAALQDLHRTPLGWLPGLILNANAFLTLNAKDFLAGVPFWMEMALTVLGWAATTVLFALTPLRSGKLLGVLGTGLLIFFGAAFSCFCLGYVWNYALFPLGAFSQYVITLQKTSKRTIGKQTEIGYEQREITL